MSQGGPPRKPSSPHLELSRKVLSEPPAIPLPEGERIMRELAGLEGRILGHLGGMSEKLDDHDWRLRAVETSVSANVLAASKLDDLSRDVRAVLLRDANQEERIGALEKEAILRGQQAGRAAGMKWGGAATLVGPIVLWVLQQIFGAHLPTQAQHTPAPIATTQLPR